MAHFIFFCITENILMNLKQKQLTFALLTVVVINSSAQDKKLTLTGSIQSDMLIPENDKETGAEKSGDFLTNTYVDLMLQHKDFEVGTRLEYMEHPLPGFENDFKGWGVPYFYAKGKLSWAELTVGTFYEQFGSGFILRTYEDRFLGIDNSLLGGRLVVKPLKGVTMKALGGKQRHYWKWNDSWISGADAEIELEEWVKALQKNDVRISVGASWVNKHENPDDIFIDPTHRVNTPRFVNAWDARACLNWSGLSVLAEYAQKTDDPSYDNQYTFGKGTAAMLSASYSHKGLSMKLQAKRSENMGFRSCRTASLNSSFINHLPPFTQEHTYALPALYPYATQFDGEWAIQAEGSYSFKRNTTLGGRYGTSVKLNYSQVRDLDYRATYYQDFNVQITRKLSSAFELYVMYMNQHYNKTVVEGEGGMIHSNIFVADGKYQFSPKTTLRGELQYLNTRQDEGDWVFGLLELSLVPHWMLTVSDQWNVGSSHIHYYQGLVTYNIGAHRIQAGYCRTQEGYSCSGGISRWIPATKGFMMSYNYNF